MKVERDRICAEVWVDQSRRVQLTPLADAMHSNPVAEPNISADIDEANYSLRMSRETGSHDVSASDGVLRKTAPAVRQLRVVVAAADFDAAIEFYRDALGLPQLAFFESDGDARVAILDAGQATLELANPAQVAMIDSVEVGRPVSPHIRIALEVTDAEGVTRRLAEAGAELIAEPTKTPWGSLNARLAGPAGLQLTLFEELGDKYA